MGLRESIGWERALLATGAVLYAALATILALVFAVDPSVARGAVAGVVAETFAGREAGIPVALSRGVPAPLVFLISVTQDLAAFFITYPIFLYLLHRHHDADNFLMRRVRRIEAAAARHEAYARRWGPVGLYFFMLVPFLINGPLVGGVLGRLAGIRTPRLLLPVVLATASAAAGWVFFFDQTIARLDEVDPRLGTFIAFGVLGVVLALGAWGLLRDEARARAAAGDEEE